MNFTMFVWYDRMGEVESVDVHSRPATFSERTRFADSYHKCVRKNVTIEVLGMCRFMTQSEARVWAKRYLDNPSGWVRVVLGDCW